MLKGFNPLLTPELLYTLARMGHGDTIAVVDANFPAHSVSQNVIRLDGVDVVTAGRAVLSVLPLDTVVDEPLERMSVIDEPDAIPAVQEEFIAMAETAAGRSVAVRSVERHDFYARARLAFGVVITGEQRPYGDFLLSKGVLPELAP